MICMRYALPVSYKNITPCKGAGCLLKLSGRWLVDLGFILLEADQGHQGVLNTRVSWSYAKLGFLDQSLGLPEWEPAGPHGNLQRNSDSAS